MRKSIAIAAGFFLAVLTCCRPGFSPIPEFQDSTNQALKEFFDRTASEKGRKVAVFDGDGTVLGQVPHYLADECLYAEAKKHPEKKPQIIQHMRPLSNVSIPYVKDRVFFFEGDTLETVRNLGVECFHRDYAGKIYEPMRKLISQLKENGFEIWIITASPEALYQKFLSEEFHIPITNIVGVKPILHGGRFTSRIVEPVPQDEGKKEAIETFVQEQPLLAAGNSRGDREMIEFSRDIRMIINPDEHREQGETTSVADYAKSHNWLIERIRDQEEPGFPAISSREYSIRRNKPH